jgi:hypothetical protein
MLYSRYQVNERCRTLYCMFHPVCCPALPCPALPCPPLPSGQAASGGGGWPQGGGCGAAAGADSAHLTAAGQCAAEGARRHCQTNGGGAGVWGCARTHLRVFSRGLGRKGGGAGVCACTMEKVDLGDVAVLLRCCGFTVVCFFMLANDSGDSVC